MITDEGEVAAVVLRRAEYDRLVDEAAFASRIRALDESRKQIERGECRDALEFLREFAAERGIQLDR